MNARKITENCEADVCVFVEGTYPYVTGGVSAWLHQLITNLSELSFSIFYLGSKPEPGRSFKYELPANVTGFQEVFLSDAAFMRATSGSSHAPQGWKKLQEFHEQLAGQKWDEAIENLKSNFTMPQENPDASALFYSEDAWNSLVERYYAHSPASPFLDYFWTFRS